MLQLLWAFSTLNAFSIKLGNASLRKTDIADSLLSHTLWDGIMRTLDYRLLGNTDLIFLVDVGVSLDGLGIPMLLCFKHLLDISLFGVKLDTPFFFLSKNNVIIIEKTLMKSNHLICSWVLCERGLHSADLDL